MSSSLNGPGEFPPEWLKCHICLAELNELAGDRHMLCSAHFAEYEVRQRQGVTADELETRWHDTLATWRDRPAAVQQEADAAGLLFRNQRGGWLLFMRGYAGRLPDWLAIHQQTGAVQRFVEVGEFDASDALLGHEPAPHQEHLEQRWGQPQSYRHPPQDSVFDLLDRHRLGRLAQEMPMTLYGVVGHPFGLHLTRVDSGAEDERLSHVALTFTGSAVDQSFYARLKLASLARASLHWLERQGMRYEKLSLESLYWPLTPSAQHVAEQTMVIAGQKQQVAFYQFPSAPDLSTVQAARERLLRGEIGNMTMAERHHLGEQLSRYERPEVLRFQRPGVPEYQFTWQEAGETVVLGESANVTLTELVHLLEQLVPINERPDLLLQYEAELRQL